MPDSYSDSADRKEITRFPIDYWRNFGLSEQTSAMRLFRDKDGMLLAIPVTPFMSNASTGTVTNLMPTAIADSQPGTDGTNVFVRAQGLPFGSGVTDSAIGLNINSRVLKWNVFNSQWAADVLQFSKRTVSAVATASVTSILFTQTAALHSTLDIHMTCSAGTATVTVEVSADNINFLTIDSIVAAATTIKHYDPTVVGGTVALCPLGFPIIRITTGSAGAGNTTTNTIVMK